MRSHSREKLVKCEVCDNSFDRSGNINRYMRLNDGEKLFKCETILMIIQVQVQVTSQTALIRTWVVSSGVGPFPTPDLHSNIHQLIDWVGGVVVHIPASNAGSRGFDSHIPQS